MTGALKCFCNTNYIILLFKLHGSGRRKELCFAIVFRIRVMSFIVLSTINMTVKGLFLISHQCNSVEFLLIYTGSETESKTVALKILGNILHNFPVK